MQSTRKGRATTSSGLGLSPVVVLTVYCWLSVASESSAINDTKYAPTTTFNTSVPRSRESVPGNRNHNLKELYIGFLAGYSHSKVKHLFRENDKKTLI